MTVIECWYAIIIAEKSYICNREELFLKKKGLFPVFIPNYQAFSPQR